MSYIFDLPSNQSRVLTRKIFTHGHFQYSSMIGVLCKHFVVILFPLAFNMAHYILISMTTCGGFCESIRKKLLGILVSIAIKK